MKPAKYWVKKEDGVVQCLLCPHQCTIKPGKEGICKNKKNIEGELYAHRYGEVSAIALDPIEKKPLYHFYPGSQILSIGTVGCNFHCKFCQNYHLVEASVPTEEVSIEELVSAAKRHNSVGIAYTYNEPTIFIEFAKDWTIDLGYEEGKGMATLITPFLRVALIGKKAAELGQKVDRKLIHMALEKEIGYIHFKLQLYGDTPTFGRELKIYLEYKGKKIFPSYLHLPPYSEFTRDYYLSLIHI